MSMLAEKRMKERWILNPRSNQWSEDSNKFGQKLLEKMGWKPGNGLGVNQQGETTHVKVAVRSDNRGIGFKKRPEDVLPHQENFSNLLEQLATTMEDPPNVSNEASSLEKKSQQSKTRVHYHKATRGKDLSRYSEKDLACILGVPTVKSGAVVGDQEATEPDELPAEEFYMESSLTSGELETRPDDGGDTFSDKPLKKKKKKKSSREAGTSDTISLEKEDANGKKNNEGETADVERLERKKNKKRKREEREAGLESEVGIQEELKDTESEKLKKKKIRETVDTETSEEAEVETDSIPSKKSTKRKLSEDSLPVEAENVEIKANKKSRKQVDVVTSETVNSDGSMHKKKKKNSNEEVSEKKEKEKYYNSGKKKKKKHAIVENEDGDCKEHEETERDSDDCKLRKKKRKRVSDQEVIASVEVVDGDIKKKKKVEEKAEDEDVEVRKKTKRRKSVTFSDELFHVVIIPPREDTNDGEDDAEDEINQDESVVLHEGIKYFNGLREGSKPNGPVTIEQWTTKKAVAGNYSLDEVFEGFPGSNVAQLGYSGLTSSKSF